MTTMVLSQNHYHSIVVKNWPSLWSGICIRIRLKTVLTHLWFERLKINGCTFSKLSCELYIKPTPISDFLWKGINVWVQKVSSNGATVKNVNFWFIIRYASLTWVGYFSQMGGLFGLCLGFRLIQHSVLQLNWCLSLLSGVELIYWFVIVLSRKVLALRWDSSPPSKS